MENEIYPNITYIEDDNRLYYSTKIRQYFEGQYWLTPFRMTVYLEAFPEWGDLVKYKIQCMSDFHKEVYIMQVTHKPFIKPKEIAYGYSILSELDPDQTSEKEREFRLFKRKSLE